MRFIALRALVAAPLAAILAVLAEVADPSTFPPFSAAMVGYGLGTARWSDRPNVLRMTLGEEAARGGLWVVRRTSTTARGSSWPGPSSRRSPPGRRTPGPRRSR